jgi:WD40 repeat protein
MKFVAISSNGRTVPANGNVPGGEAEAAGLWTFPTGDYLRSIEGDPVAISADFRYVATETSVQDLQTGKIIFQISQQADILRNAAFSPSGENVALVAGGSAARVHRAQIIVLKTTDGSMTSSFGIRHTLALAFHPDNQTVASGHWNNATLWDVRTGARLALLMSPPRRVDPTGYNRDGKMLAAGSDDGELHIWEMTTRKLLHSIKIGSRDASNPVFSPNGKFVAAGTYADGTLSLVDVSSGTVLSQIQVSMFGSGPVAFTGWSISDYAV